MKQIISILVVSGNKSDNQNQIIAQLSSQDDFRVVGVVKDDADAIIKSITLEPDVLILDLQALGMDGTELAPIIHRRSPSSAIILMSGKDDDIYTCSALKAGISGILVNEEDKEKLVSIVRIVHLGGNYINSLINDRICNAVLLMDYFLSQFAHCLEFEQKDMADRLSISPTERSIIICIVRGYTDRETAEFLHLNIGSVRNCVLSIKRKTKVKSRVHIAIFSLINGIIN
jgi:DNA-binding NarL/FixJ family response regulator